MAGSGGDSEEGVSAEAAFQQYDKDGSGTIDASELEVLLQDLGVEPSEERLRGAFEELDKNGDGVISFEGQLMLHLSDLYQIDCLILFLSCSYRI